MSSRTFLYQPTSEVFVLCNRRRDVGRMGQLSACGDQIMVACGFTAGPKSLGHMAGQGHFSSLGNDISPAVGIMMFAKAQYCALQSLEYLTHIPSARHRNSQASNFRLSRGHTFRRAYESEPHHGYGWCPQRVTPVCLMFFVVVLLDQLDSLPTSMLEF